MYELRSRKWNTDIPESSEPGWETDTEHDTEHLTMKPHTIHCCCYDISEPLSYEDSQSTASSSVPLQYRLSYRRLVYLLYLVIAILIFIIYIQYLHFSSTISWADSQIHQMWNRISQMDKHLSEREVDSLRRWCFWSIWEEEGRAPREVDEGTHCVCVRDGRYGEADLPFKINYVSTSTCALVELL